MLTLIVKISRHPCSATLFCHRDEKPVPASLLESALTKRDARNPFRFRSYENCRVSPRPELSFLNFYFNFSASPRSLSFLFALFVQRVKAYPFVCNDFCTLSKNCQVYGVSSHSGISVGLSCGERGRGNQRLAPGRNGLFFHEPAPILSGSAVTSHQSPTLSAGNASCR
jgi:hypothetical protein